MWRRVSCEQPLNTSQSILRLRGSLDQMFCLFLSWDFNANCSRKGIWSIFQNLGAEPTGPSYPLWQRDTTRRRPPELWGELSFLHKPLRPWNPLAGRMGFGSRRRVLQFSQHPRAPGGTLKILGRLRRTRPSSYPYPQQVSKVNSLWSIE